MSEATITSKGQITIPKDVRDKLSLHTGDVVVFTVVDGEAIMTKREQPCPICGGSGRLEGLECFICEGKGFCSKHDRILVEILNKARAYGMRVQVENNGALPRVTFDSPSVPRHILDKYQDYCQMKIISEYSPRSPFDPGRFQIPSDDLLREILSYLKLDESKEKVRGWFRA